MQVYNRNSPHKELVRDRWVDFIKKVEISEQNGYQIITFPSEEMQDIEKFAEAGLIDWEPAETEESGKRITRGNVICFERNPQKYRNLMRQLSGANFQKDFNDVLIKRFDELKKGAGNLKIFPVDAINLDYESSLSKNDVINIIHRIFQLQVMYEKDFCIFLTWPIPNNISDEDEQLITAFQNVINDNLQDMNAVVFTGQYNENYGAVKELKFPELSIIGLTKKILKISSEHRFQLDAQEFIQYGDAGRRRMVSVLYHFKFKGDEKAGPLLYSEDVPKALTKITNINGEE